MSKFRYWHIGNHNHIYLLRVKVFFNLIKLFLTCRVKWEQAVQNQKQLLSSSVSDSPGFMISHSRVKGEDDERSNIRISYFSPSTIYTDFPSQSKKQHTIYISSNNLEHIFCFINTAQSGLSLFEAEPATDYLVREPRLSSCRMRGLWRRTVCTVKHSRICLLYISNQMSNKFQTFRLVNGACLSLLLFSCWIPFFVQDSNQKKDNTECEIYMQAPQRTTPENLGDHLTFPLKTT